MSESTVVASRIKKKEAEIQGLEERLRAARIYLQALQDVLGAIERESEGTIDPGLRVGSSVAQAREVIMRAKKPVHISDLLAALGKGVTKETRASLSSSLAAYVRRGEVFTRSAPNTFGLIELGHPSEGDLDTDPPVGFGGSAHASAEGEAEIPF